MSSNSKDTQASSLPIFPSFSAAFSYPVGDGVFDKEVKPVSANAIHHHGEQKYLSVWLLVDLAF